MTSKLGLELLTHSEGCRLESYQDDGGKWTIGFGTTMYPFGKPVQPGDKLESKEQAFALLQHDLKIFEVGVAKLVNVPLDQWEFDALVVLAYNIGLGEKGLGGSTILKLINSGGSIDEIEEWWMKWNKIKGKFNQGLLNRRKAEFHLFKTGTLKYFN